MPCLVKADGTIITPTAETWKIRNDSPQPVTLDTAAADTITSGTSITAKSQPATLYEDDTQDGKGSYTIAIDDTGNETRAEGGTDEHPVQIEPGKSLGFDWDVQLPTHFLNCAPPQPITVADISMTFKTIRKTAFAVYSDTDKSLDFYKRIRIPQVGETLNGKTVTNIYTGFETETYYCTKAGSQYGAYYEDDAVINTPWYGKRLDIKTVEVVDNGIKPQSVQFWFSNLHNCTSLRLNRLDTSQCTSLLCTFNRCKSATDIEISNWDVYNVAGMIETFLECHDLQNLNLSGWTTSSNLNLHSTWNNCYLLTSLDFGNGWSTSKVKDFACTFTGCRRLTHLDSAAFDTRSATTMYNMFSECRSLKLDCSSWNVSNVSNHTDFSAYAIGVILPKPWQAGAFSIYSADDGSFDFYKCVNCELPTAGSIFNGKTITSIYTGFEEDAYTGTWPNDNCPWFDIATKVKSVTVVDTIKPKSMAWWFNQFCNCKSFDLGNIDTSECVSLRRIFSTCCDCTSITGLDKWNTESIIDLSAGFDGLNKLETIPGISNWNTSNVKYFALTFYNLDSLERLDLSKWDDSSMIPDAWVDGIGYSKGIIGTGGGTMIHFKSFSIGAKWSHTSNLARSIELASSGTIPTDGKWYAASDGAAYESTAVPNNKGDTYYASAILAVAAKDAASWTLDDQQTAAKDIAVKGEASPFYAKAKAAMDAGTTWSIRLTDGSTMTYRLIGINHDNLADGSGKAGFTFLTISTGIQSRMNARSVDSGGWGKSELRQKMNDGEIWNLMPSDFQSKVKLVKKLTNNVPGSDNNAAVTSTLDRLFLLSYSEIVPNSWWKHDYPWSSFEGTQYEAFKGKVTENYRSNQAIAIPDYWWERTVHPGFSSGFLYVDSAGAASNGTTAISRNCICPAWCF